MNGMIAVCLRMLIGLDDFCNTLVTSSQYMQDYPNLAELAHVALIIPVTNVECEREFSC